MIIKKQFFSLALLLPLPLAAANFDIHGGGGIAKFHTSNSSMMVSQSEIDTLGDPNNGWDNGIYQLGFSFFPGSAIPEPGAFNLLHTMSFQVNAYHIAEDNFSGPVYRFGDHTLHDYNYKMNLRSTRVMADAVFNAFSFNNLGIYGKLGVGEAWNRVDYSDYPIDGSDSSSISIHRKTRSGVAVEAGAGVQYNFTNGLGISFEYLYVDMDRVRLGHASSNSCLDGIVSPTLSLESSAFLLNLHWMFA
ncbi:Opacity protein and related surface antigens [Legionella busanensis]|uniref:Opacity protein and related surface antigens n=1 Tax=Legionella busanensis TaxID=190655 RepID=A0A378JRT3_9GAMM|nr:outer membrane beta-barrel protein [Legionella busanensis]STX50842.1 Opacity protein and related surface antigens [Legionella busanensis]